ncbi:hypothetical protein AMK31_32535 [Streptomyces sp. TSRI0107]|nr:hypothetical protein AMK31_32535 [Streptomyces sp. TSRI0107]
MPCATLAHVTDTTNPLAGLDAIDWAELSHAYGEADDVPGQLRALCDPDAEVRGKALHALYGNIFHQGSRYEASAVAVPFLARLAADSALPGRADVVGLLAALAVGYDEAHLPDGVDVAGWRREIAEFAAQDREELLAGYDAWVAAAPDEGERAVREMRRATFDFELHLSAGQAELRAYDAVRGELAGLAALLDDPDPAVRAATAHLLAWFPEEAAHTLPGLLRLAGEEREPAVRATAIVAAGLIANADTDTGTDADADADTNTDADAETADTAHADRLRTHLAARETVVRWAAATALARLGHGGDPAVLAELAATAAAPPEPGPPGVPFHDGDLRGYAASTLTRLADRFPDEALDAVTDGLAATSGPGSFAVTQAALHMAFGPERPDRLPAHAELDARRQRLIRVLADLGEDTWRWGNFLAILRGWGLPTDRQELRAYAGMQGM